MRKEVWFLLGLCLLSLSKYVVGELSSVDYWYYLEPRTSASTYIEPEFPPSGGKFLSCHNLKGEE